MVKLIRNSCRKLFGLRGTKPFLSYMQEDIISLQAKASSLEEELVKFKQEAANAHNTIKRFEKVHSLSIIILIETQTK